MLYPIVTIILISCSINITGKAVQIPSETGKNTEVYFCPKDDCGKVFESKIDNANFSVHCAIYDINLRNVINSLAKKSKTADVKVVMDNSNNHSQLKGAGVREDTSSQLMHNKFCIIDKNTVVTGSFNPTDNDNYHNNNNVLVVYSKALAENYENEFDELWSGKFSSGNKVKHPIVYMNGIKIENYFCPEDNCASHIVDLIKSAKQSVYFMDFSFTSEEIADAIILKKSIDTRGVVDAGQSSNKYSQLKRLQDFGINAKKDANKYKMHHKVFIIDNRTIATGSFNPTLSGDERNDENVIIMHDKNITSYFLKEFDDVFH